MRQTQAPAQPPGEGLARWDGRAFLASESTPPFEVDRLQVGQGWARLKRQAQVDTQPTPHQRGVTDEKSGVCGLGSESREPANGAFQVSTGISEN